MEAGTGGRDGRPGEMALYVSVFVPNVCIII